jgi:hypothetical protein
MHSGATLIPRLIAQSAGIFSNPTLFRVFSVQHKSSTSQAISSLCQAESKAAAEFDGCY